jgi:hypothetical protein
MPTTTTHTPLFDPDELNQVEEMLVRVGTRLLGNISMESVEVLIGRAMVRAMRTAAKEGLFARQAPVPVTPLPADAIREVPETETGEAPVKEDVAVEVPPELPRHEVIKKRKQEKGKRRSVRNVLASVGPRPHGYVTTDEMRATMTPAGAAQLNSWIMEKQVPAVIVHDTKLTATKGMKGRVFVDKQAALNRDAQRISNAEALKAGGPRKMAGYGQTAS